MYALHQRWSWIGIYILPVGHSVVTDVGLPILNDHQKLKRSESSKDNHRKSPSSPSPSLQKASSRVISTSLDAMRNCRIAPWEEFSHSALGGGGVMLPDILWRGWVVLRCSTHFALKKYSWGMPSSFCKRAANSRLGISWIFCGGA